MPNGGVNAQFLKEFDQFIRQQVKKGRRFFIVTGGGKTARHYINAGKQVIGQVTDEDLDWIGIHTTRLNAHLMRTIFQDIAHPRTIENYDKRLIKWREPVVIGAGWKPGWSTDYDAVVLARDYKASVLINLSNTDWVYDKDPVRNKDAKPIKRLTWDNFEDLVGDKWIPGTNAPFDPVAAQLAKKIGLTVIVTNGRDFKNLRNILNGESFKGTVIMPFRVDASFYDREYYEGKKSEYRLGYSKSLLGDLLQNLANIYRALSIKLFINPKSCLDVGCGTGRLVYFLRKFGVEAYGIEISRYALEIADSQLKPYLKYGDITNIPYQDDRFDLVSTFDVLEHLERSKLKKAVEETVRVSKKCILHKIYTIENTWINLFHGQDFSHLSVLSREFWANIFKEMKNVSLTRRFIFKLPFFLETIFLLRKKKG